ncbi:putative MFS multidrug transporter [Venturia nashicola]|nr:putative MFS multidrug transporter [Venturia nashicola]
MFFTEPIVFAVTIMGSTVYASAYLLTELVPSIYSGFGLTLQQGGLVFLAIGVGATTLPIPIRLCDSRIGHKRKHQNRDLVPEEKLLGFFIASPVQAISIWWFAWTIPPYMRHSPFVSIAALVPLGFAINEFDYVLVGYLCDTYTSDAGSANAPTGFIRASLSAICPLFSPAIFKSLGNNVAASMLAAIATAYCFFAFTFWRYGEKPRERSLWAKKNERGK